MYNARNIHTELLTIVMIANPQRTGNLNPALRRIVRRRPNESARMPPIIWNIADAELETVIARPTKM